MAIRLLALDVTEHSPTEESTWTAREGNSKRFEHQGRHGYCPPAGCRSGDRLYIRPFFPQLLRSGHWTSSFSPGFQRQLRTSCPFSKKIAEDLGILSPRPAFMGDDVKMLSVFGRAGMGIVPADGMDGAKRAADFVTASCAGTAQ